jgi:peptidoglycan/LPS O-acetylase OafA/YrhL
MSTLDRRYDIDWLRVIAIGLLLVYHTAICFQPWGFMLGFIANDKALEALWIPMAMLNLWRIPILFFISGMGVYFSCQHRSWKQLLRERAKRILVPFIFGLFCIVPIQIFIVQRYYHQPLQYIANPAHLWFLGNIFIYLLLLLPLLFYMKRNENSHFIITLKKILAGPICLLIVIAAFIAEAFLLQPMLYELYAMTWHGFFLGLLAFFFGYMFMLGGEPFWSMLRRWRYILLAIALALYIYRLTQPQMKVRQTLLVIESQCWIFSIFALGYTYLRQPGKKLQYLSLAAYPVYIIHMVILYLAAWLVIPLELAVPLKYVAVLVLTVSGSLAIYELIIKRVNLYRILFGLKESG